MLVLPTALVVLASQALPGALAAPVPSAAQAAAEDQSGLVPADAAVLVRLESLDAFHASVERLMGTFDDSGNAPDKAELLDLFNLPVGLDGVDTTRPVFIGMDVTLGQPLVTALLPASDAAAIQAAAAEAGAKSAVRGDWVGVSTKPAYAPTASNPLLAAMQPGVVSVHVDLEALLELYGGLIEMMLVQAEAGIAQEAPPGAEGVDVTAMTELGLDGFRLFLDSAESLDLALNESGSELSLSGRYTALEGSDLAGLTSSLPLPQALPVSLDDDAAMSVLVSGDWSELMTTFGPLIETFDAIYPASMRAGMKAYMDSLAGVYEDLGDVVVGSIGIGAQGFQVSTYVTSEAEDADARFAAGVVAALESSGQALSGFGVTFGTPESLEIEGVSATRLPMNVDYDKLAEISLVGVPEADRAEALAATTGMLRSIYGEHPIITIAQSGERICVDMGGDEARLKQAVARLKEEPVSSGPLLAGLHGLPAAANPLVLYRIDLGAWMRSMGPIMDAAGAGAEMPQFPEGVELDTTFWMALDGRQWCGGLTLDPAELKQLIDASR